MPDPLDPVEALRRIAEGECVTTGTVVRIPCVAERCWPCVARAALAALPAPVPEQIAGEAPTRKDGAATTDAVSTSPAAGPVGEEGPETDAERDARHAPENDRIWGEGNWLCCPTCPPDDLGREPYHHRNAHPPPPAPEGVPEDRLVPDGWRVEWQGCCPDEGCVRNDVPRLVPLSDTPQVAEGEQP